MVAEAGPRVICMLPQMPVSAQQRPTPSCSWNCCLPWWLYGTLPCSYWCIMLYGNLHRLNDGNLIFSFFFYNEAESILWDSWDFLWYFRGNSREPCLDNDMEVVCFKVLTVRGDRIMTILTILLETCDTILKHEAQVARDTWKVSEPDT